MSAETRHRGLMAIQWPSSNVSRVFLKEEVMAFRHEFHSRGKLSKTIGATFIARIPKNKWS